MKLLRRLIELFNGHSTVDTSPIPRPDSLEHSLLKVLPIELIGYIAEFLPLQAAVSFTLTCGPVWHILGNRYLDRLKTKGYETHRLAYLELLERDLPRQILCSDCRMFHSDSFWKHLSRTFSTKHYPCAETDILADVEHYIHRGFCSFLFQSAMKLHRRGLDCSVDLAMLTKSRSSFGRGYNYRWESIPRIINGHLLLRYQLWLLFPVRHEVIVPRIKFMDVCPHLRFNCSSSTGIRQKMACRVSHWENSERNLNCPICLGLVQCKTCPTEFQINTKNFPKHGMCLVLTRWMDLGEGRTLSDPTYASHVSHKHDSNYQYVRVPFEAGSLRAAYEGERPDLEGFLTPRHTFELLWMPPR